AVRAVGSNDRPGEDEGLEPFGKDGAGHAGNPAADVVEAAAATQDFPYDQQGPPAAQHLVGARHGAELTVSRHADNLARRARPGSVRIPDLLTGRLRSLARSDRPART